MGTLGSDWRRIDGAAMAWFGADDLSQGAQFAERVFERESAATLELRPVGVRMRARDDDTVALSTIAADLGLVADPSVLQQVGLTFCSSEPQSIAPFWRSALGYQPSQQGLSDPLRRDPDVRFEPLSDPRPLRNRIHLDVVRPEPVINGLGLGAGTGPYGVCQVDAEGNEVDLVPGEPLGGRPEISDWWAVFSAVACYRTSTVEQQTALTAAAARAADGVGFPLIIDLRPGLVIIDSGKDRWEPAAHGLSIDFADLAAAVQSDARRLGATADPALPRFVQVFLDAADVATVRRFWSTALGWVADPRPGVTDVHDPLRLGPSLVFQELDPAEVDRRQQRNRIRINLTLAADSVSARREACVSAGGRLLDVSDTQTLVTDPEGNELLIIAAA
ncbi:hypothetical protein FHX74_002368 [Friedmanniella endophytica]|uniref:Glyoxalase-like domain-containing protein n=1 Tax=Microlunatus kandeliicorticis TaxID=1759536 RepID=A0A7W3IT45_9ACTN|nr:VOC family protein [Microlunatus kandeliicorticis]MBA8794749.1 hypothetical protein [Microlunatus kandeliicorticis]